MLDLNNISVLNEHYNQVFAHGRLDNYSFRPAKGNRPTEIVMPMSELKHINSNSELISTGWLTFFDEDKEEIFKELRIKDWRNILTIADIKDILLNPTTEKLQRILDIENIAYMDRVKMILHMLKGDGKNISYQVDNLVNERYRELMKRIRKTEISLVKKAPAIHVDKEMDALKQQNEALQNRLDQMQKMLEAFMQSNPAATVTDTEETSETTKKKTGRKTTTAKTTE